MAPATTFARREIDPCAIAQISYVDLVFSFSPTTPHARLVRSIDELDGVVFPAVVKPSGTSDRHDDEAPCIVHEPAALELAVSYMLARHPYGVLIEPYVCAICADRPVPAR